MRKARGTWIESSDGTIYHSIREMSDLTGINRRTISNYLKSGEPYKGQHLQENKRVCFYLK